MEFSHQWLQEQSPTSVSGAPFFFINTADTPVAAPYLTSQVVRLSIVTLRCRPRHSTRIIGCEPALLLFPPQKDLSSRDAERSLRLFLTPTSTELSIFFFLEAEPPSPLALFKNLLSPPPGAICIA